MPKFDPQLSQINSTPFITSGVKDDSLSGLLKNAFSIGTDAYVGYKTADLQKAITKEADQYFNPELTPEAQQLGQEVGSMEMAFDNQFPTDIDGVKALDKLNKSFESKLQSYAAAASQGRMSVSELESRILSVTRQAVNKNPLLQRELLATADKYMELSGLGSYIKSQQAAEKSSADWQMKQIGAIFDEAEKLNVPVDRLADPYAEARRIQPLMMQAQLQRQAKAELDFASQSNTVLGKEKAKQWVLQNGGAAYQGDLLDFQTQAVSLLRNSQSPQDYNSAKLQIHTLASNLYQSRRHLGMMNGINSEQEYKDWIEAYRYSFDDLLKNLDSFGSGKDAADWIETRVKTLQGEQEYAMSQKYNIPQLRTASQLLSVIPPGLQQKWATQNPGAIEKQLDTIYDMVTGVQTPATEKAIVNKGAAKTTPYGDIVASVAANPEQQVHLPKLLEAGNKQLAMATDATQKAMAYDGFFQAVNGQEKLALDDNSKEAMRKFIGNYMSSNVGMPSLVANMKAHEGQVQLDINPDGYIGFTGPMGEQFTRKFGARMNQALQTYAKSYGISVKEALPRFAEEFMGKEPEGRWEARTPDDVMKLVEDGTITHKQATLILSDMAKAAKSKPTEETVKPVQVEAPPPVETISQKPPLPKAPKVESQPAKVAKRVAERVKENAAKIGITGVSDNPMDIYGEQKKISPEGAAHNKKLMSELESKENIARAEMDVVGHNGIAPLSQVELRTRLGVIARAKAEGKPIPPYVTTDLDRVRKGEKWFFHSKDKNGTYLWNEKDQVFLLVKDVSEFEKKFKIKLDAIPKVGGK